jgi:hypothetical protein
MKTRRFCPHCGWELRKSQQKGYAFQCLYCWEDFYKIEVLRKKDMEKIKALRRSSPVSYCNRWWYSTDFKTMETVSGFRQPDFDPTESYYRFVNACDDWWENHSKKDKIAIYKEYK